MRGALKLGLLSCSALSLAWRLLRTGRDRARARAVHVPLAWTTPPPPSPRGIPPPPRSLSAVLMPLDADECDRLLARLHLERHVLLGLDAEWQPERGGRPSRLAVLQLAAGDAVYIFRLLHTRGGVPRRLRALLEDPAAVKAGVGVHEDARRLLRDHGVVAAGLLDVRALLQAHPALAAAAAAAVAHQPARRRGHAGEEDGGDGAAAVAGSAAALPAPAADPRRVVQGGASLRALAATLLGLELDKAQQVSQWQLAQLSAEQAAYAARDAWVGPQLVLRLFAQLPLAAAATAAAPAATAAAAAAAPAGAAAAAGAGAGGDGGHESTRSAALGGGGAIPGGQPDARSALLAFVGPSVGRLPSHHAPGGSSAPASRTAAAAARAGARGAGAAAAASSDRWAGLKPARQPVRKALLYENCRILAPDGSVLCTCGRKKVFWYLQRGLADLVDANGEPLPAEALAAEQQATAVGGAQGAPPTPPPLQQQQRQRRQEQGWGPGQAAEPLRQPSPPQQQDAAAAAAAAAAAGAPPPPPPPQLPSPPPQRHQQRELSRPPGALTRAASVGSEGAPEHAHAPAAAAAAAALGAAAGTAAAPPAPPDVPAPLIIRLRFEPRGRGHADDWYYLSSKDNTCVVCGRRGEFLRHSVVPHCYRQHFPDYMKSHLSHDVVLLCTSCHQRANMLDTRRMQELGIQHSAPLEREALRFRTDPALAAVRSAAKALRTAGEALPPERRAHLAAVVAAHFAGGERRRREGGEAEGPREGAEQEQAQPRRGRQLGQQQGRQDRQQQGQRRRRPPRRAERCAGPHDAPNGARDPPAPMAPAPRPPSPAGGRGGGGAETASSEPPRQGSSGQGAEPPPPPPPLPRQAAQAEEGSAAALEPWMVDAGCRLQVRMLNDAWSSHARLVVQSVMKGVAAGCGAPADEGHASPLLPEVGAAAAAVDGGGARAAAGPGPATDWGVSTPAEVRLEAFVKGWRAHFLQGMQPRFLPPFWSVDARVANSSVKGAVVTQRV